MCIRKFGSLCCFSLALFLLGCEWKPSTYKIATVRSLDDLDKEYSIDVTAGNQYVYLFNPAVTNREIQEADHISISLVNRTDHTLKFDAVTNDFFRNLSLETNESVEIYNGNLLGKNRGNRLRIKRDDKYTFKVKLNDNYTNFPLRIRIAPIGT